LPASVLHQDARPGAQRRVGVQDRARKACIELRIGLGGIDLAQGDPAVRRSQIEHAIRKIAVLVFARQRDTGLAGLAHAPDHVDGRRLLRLELDAPADRHDRIEHRALAPGKRFQHRARTGDGALSSDEAGAIGFVGNFPGVAAVNRHQVDHPGRLLGR
jgi:hypothetical protein